MGTEYSIAKREPRETFYLGKAKTGYSTIDELPKVQNTPAPESGPERIEWLKSLSSALVHPATKALWSIMHEDSYAIFKLSPADRGNLAERLFQGASAIETRYQADIVANAIIEWAGDAELTLINDDGISAVQHLGFKPGQYSQTGSVYEVLTTEG